jgi:uncharacterized protein (TIGR03000 family)
MAPAYAPGAYSGQVIYGSEGAYYIDPNAPAVNVQPADTVPQTGQPTPVDSNRPPLPEDGGVQPGSDSATPDTAGDAVLRLNVPDDCVVTINGRRTKTEGASRKYVSRNLRYDQVYPYEIQATVVRNGQTLSQTKVVDLSGGIDRSVEIAFDDDAQVLTSLALTVPTGAQVTLGGTPTRAEGSFRYYSTKALEKGQTWEDYEIKVTLERDGQLLTQTKHVDLSAGESLELDFDFETTAVAQK